VLRRAAARRLGLGLRPAKALALSLLGYAVGHALCAAMPSYAALLPLRAVTMLGAAVFTPQAGAAIGFMSPPEHRGRAIAFIFLGWSLASVLGLPMANWIGETFGWRYAFSGSPCSRSWPRPGSTP
jgi:predicted MFS family arabinose efflux permease